MGPVGCQAKAKAHAHATEDITTYLLYFTPKYGACRWRILANAATDLACVRSDVRMLASRWKTRVVVKMASAMLLWGVDTVLAVWASIIFLLQYVVVRCTRCLCTALTQLPGFVRPVVHNKLRLSGSRSPPYFPSRSPTSSRGCVGCAVVLLLVHGIPTPVVTIVSVRRQLKGIRWVRSQTKEQLVAYARAYMFQHRKANQATGYQLQGSSQDGDYQGKLGTGDVDVNVSSKTGDVVDFTLKSFHADMQSSARLMAKAICRFTGIHAFCLVVCLGTLFVAMGTVSA